ncbi:hypothetical protein PoB_002681300 [Plakobranchus ocellatus]|uniref:Uncharacterized protein n=1 Tax=Plakobranchus ocellatus TaxID=259542 RepID=A0AAV3ZZJ0_9GAST|nr:hypothetical protein PoB_002681300 [Plakobranchus ocellatus]
MFSKLNQLLEQYGECAGETPHLCVYNGMCYGHTEFCHKDEDKIQPCLSDDQGLDWCKMHYNNISMMPSPQCLKACLVKYNLTELTSVPRQENFGQQISECGISDCFTVNGIIVIMALLIIFLVVSIMLNIMLCIRRHTGKLTFKAENKRKDEPIENPTVERLDQMQPNHDGEQGHENGTLLGFLLHGDPGHPPIGTVPLGVINIPWSDSNRLLGRDASPIEDEDQVPQGHEFEPNIGEEAAASESSGRSSSATVSGTTDNTSSLPSPLPECNEIGNRAMCTPKTAYDHAST